MAAVVSAKDLCLKFSLQEVLREATFAIEEGEKAALIGRNGSGKSSLMKIIAGLEKPDSGTLSLRQGLVIGHLPQEFSLRDDATVLENVRDGAAWIYALLERYEGGSARGAEEAALLDRITTAGGWDIESRIATAMNELALPPAEQRVGPLSGGEKRRVALCRALAGNPDLLLLDEPTNHLDAESISWLEQYLLAFRGACLFVTHDRYFLDRLAQRILELDEGRVFSHPGNYTRFLETKEERRAAGLAREDRRQKFLRSELEFVRAGVKAQRRKSRYRLEQYYEIASQAAPPEELDIELLIPPPPPLANIVVEARDLGMSLAGRQLFSGLSLAFEPGTITGIVGRNGVGKTTLLRLLMAEMQPTEGAVTVGKRTAFNYVDQHRLALDGSKSVLEEIGGNSEFIAFGGQKLHIRTYLKRFLFTDERVLMRVDRLSGGERSRLLLAKILVRGGNFLVLDEPTNDLDLQTLRILEEALLDFPGCAVVVSHDRYFLDRVCDRVLVFEGTGRLQVCAGNHRYYLEKNTARLAAERSAAAQESKPAKIPTRAESAKPRKLTWKEERELEGIEARIASAEDEISSLEQSLTEPEFYVKHGSATADYLRQLEDKRCALHDLYARWEDLESIKAACEA
ncbi:MAG: ATP-binding cassette domain-containing protein [Verrucomicrobiales bacterium]|nr:ATP-binding cassette domain-containing protein [Verrucomicrobiales bacterium]